MKLSQVKEALNEIETVAFELPNGKEVPAHFHLTEIGNIHKQFMDCGGTMRSETKVSFQLWTSTDIDHRLRADKLQRIIDLAKDKISLEDALVEVEYQGDTIEKYGLEFDGKKFLLTTMKTDCLAQDQCGIPIQKEKKQLSELAGACCPPGCCD